MRKMLESFADVSINVFIFVNKVIQQCVLFMNTLMTFDDFDTRKYPKLPLNVMLIYAGITNFHDILDLNFKGQSMLFIAYNYVKKVYQRI